MSDAGIRPLGPIEELDTPERVRLDLELAGPMSRAFAFSIDWGLILILMLAGLLVLVAGSQQILDWLSQFSLIEDAFTRLSEWIADPEGVDPDEMLRGLALSIAIWMILDLILTTCYFLFFETLLRGRTPGKMLTRLRVVSTDGRVIGWRQSLLRNLLRMVDYLPAGYLVGVVAMVASPRVQRLGDLVAGTIVVRERQAFDLAGDLDAVVAPDIEAGFRFTRDELVAVGEVERRLIRRTLRRAESLPKSEARPIVERTTQAITRRISRSGPVAPTQQRDFLLALLRASERLL